VIVLDAYAVLAFLRAEPAADEVAAMLRQQCAISAANLAETFDQLVRVYGRPPDDVFADLALLAHAGLGVLDVDADIALAAGELRARHHHRERSAVSLADCLAAATTLAHDARLATADPPLASLVRAEGGQVAALPDSRGRRP
jgi:PIN domain nuclease of toxin-antitoxin system